MIEIKNLSKKIGNNLILDNISFSVNKGEVVGFLGPNGAGKTTTMKIITSFWQPTSGSVIVGGEDAVADSLAARAKIGYLPETVPLYEDMKVREYLKFVAEMRGIGRKDIKSRIEEVVESCGLKAVIEKPIDDLSKGYRQRVGLAQAIIHNPEALILDEPTTGLDPNQVAEIRELIKKIGREKTVIFSTHILSEASAVCDRVLIINNGKICGEGRPEELIKKVSGKDALYAKIKGSEAQVLAILKTVQGVASAKIKDREGDNLAGYEIESLDGADLREAVSRAVFSSGLAILEMKKTSATLEDAFRELTK